MALRSPIFDKIMNDMNSNSKLASVDGIVKQGTLANTENMFDTNSPIPIGEGPQMGDPDTLPSNPNPTINEQSDGFLDKLWDVETKGGKLSNRPGSQYKGIGQLGDDVRKPLLAKHGYTEEQYDSDINIQKKISTAHINDLKRRMGSDATDLDLWGGHNMGVSGWKQIKSGNVSPTVLRNLRNQKGMNSKSTPKDYINYYSKIFN